MKYLNAYAAAFLIATMLLSFSLGQPQIEATVETDEQSYLIGDTVYLAGTLTGSSGEPIQHGTVSIQVENPAGEIIHIELVYSDTTGKYIDSFVLVSDTVLGAYTVYITASKAGYADGQASTTFTVSDQKTTDFTITVEPKTQSFTPGDTLTFTVNVLSSKGSLLYVTLTASGLPEGSSVSFTPNVVTPPATSIMKIVTSNSTSTGSYTIQVTGSGGGKTHIVEVTISSTQPSRCFIATATYGSELSPEVQFLRRYRDQVVTRTFAGSEFMKIFNMWYYSFSPSIADFEVRHEILRTIIKHLLYPLLGILHIAIQVQGVVNFDQEVGVIIAGFVASSLIGAVYLSPILQLSLLLSRSRFRLPKGVDPSILLLLCCGGLLEIFFGELFSISVLMMFGTGQFILGSLLAGVLISKLWEKFSNLDLQI